MFQCSSCIYGCWFFYDRAASNIISLGLFCYATWPTPPNHIKGNMMWLFGCLWAHWFCTRNWTLQSSRAFWSVALLRCLLGLGPWNWPEKLKKDLRDKRGVFFTFVVLQTPCSASWHCNSNVLEYRKKMFTGHWNLLDLFQVALNVLSAIVNCHLCNPLGGHGGILSNSPYLATVAGKDNNVKYIFVSFMCIIYCF